MSKAVRKERKKILVDHFFLPILVDKKKRNKKASVLWRTNTRKRILVRQKRRLCALAPIEPRSRPMSIGREPSSSREEEQRSLFTLSPSLFRARNTNTITTTTRKSTIPDRFSSTSSLLIQEAKEKEKERGERGTRGRRKVFGAHQADPGEGHGLFCVR